MANVHHSIQDTRNQKKKRLDAAEVVIPPVADPISRQRALDDPIFFIEHCCAMTLQHKLPPVLQDFVLQCVTSAKTGGNVLVVLPRGCGKTTILTDTLLYCLVAELVHFPVIVAATQLQANAILRNLWGILEKSQPMYDCFPELCHCIRDIDGRYQRANLQHIKGDRTNIRISQTEAHLPDIGGKIGATIVARGAGGSIRGLLAGDGTRPDWVVCDDLQKASTARSRTQLDALERYIREDIRGLSAGSSLISVFIAATPLAPDDIVDRLSKKPDVTTIRKPLVLKWPTEKELWKEWEDHLFIDLASGTTTAHDFYVSNKAAMDEGSEVLDPLAYPPNMSSALERAFYLRATMGKEAFNQEYLLIPRQERESLALDPVEVSKKLSLVPHRTVPRECPVLLASIDVGTESGIHVSVVAYGRHQKATIVDAYRFPEEGRLGPRNVPEEQTKAIITKALVGIITNLIAPGRYRMEVSGKAVPITAIAIDRGYSTAVVDSVAAYFLRKRIAVFPTKGWPNTGYRVSKSTLGKAENVDLRDGGEGNPRWLAYNADVLKVIVMQAFRGEPLTTGSLSLWGDDPVKVYSVACEIAGEKLLETLKSASGELYRWGASSTGAQNHFLDTLVMSIALAVWLRYREGESVSSMVDAPPLVQQAPKAEQKRPVRDTPQVRLPSKIRLKATGRKAKIRLASKY